MSQFVQDPELCRKYARFASHMVRWQFKIIYWSMFISNLIVLFIASWTLIRYVAVHSPELKTHANSAPRGQEIIKEYDGHRLKRARHLRRYIFACLGCVCVSTVIVIMEAFALMALQFCDGEDLMALYWSTWTMIQVGSLIAMVGIILAQVHSLKDRKHP